MDGQADWREHQGVGSREKEQVFLLPRGAAARGRAVVVRAAAAGERRVAAERPADAADPVSESEAVPDVHRCL